MPHTPGVPHMPTPHPPPEGMQEEELAEEDAVRAAKVEYS